MLSSHPGEHRKNIRPELPVPTRPNVTHPALLGGEQLRPFAFKGSPSTVSPQQIIHSDRFANTLNSSTSLNKRARE